MGTKPSKKRVAQEDIEGSNLIYDYRHTGWGHNIELSLSEYKEDPINIMGFCGYMGNTVQNNGTGVIKKGDWILFRIPGTSRPVSGGYEHDMTIRHVKNVNWMRDPQDMFSASVSGDIYYDEKLLKKFDQCVGINLRSEMERGWIYTRLYGPIIHPDRKVDVTF